MEKINNSEVFDDQLEKIFRDRDLNRLHEEMIEAINRSKGERLKSKKEREHRFKTQGMALCLSALLLFTIVTLRKNVQNSITNSNTIGYEITDDNEKKTVIDSIKDYMSKNSLDSELNMFNLSRKIGELIDGKDETILKKCTYTIAGGYVYNLSKAAHDITSLDKDLQTYAICATLNDMGKNRENYIEEIKSTNQDFLIKNIKLLKISDESLQEAEKEFWEDINSAEDYYKKLGALDKDGKPSFKENKRINDDNAEVILEIVKEELNSDKGVTK